MKKQKSGAAGGMLLSLLTGGLGTVLCAVLLLVPCAMLVSGGKLGEDTGPLLTLAVCFLSALVGSLLAWRRLRARALLLGLGSAVLAFVLLLLLGFLFWGGLPLGAQVLSIFLALVLGGLLGGACRLLKKKRRK